MRTPLLILLTATLVAGEACRCSPATPSPVVLRVKNASRDPIFVDDTTGDLGLTVQRSAQGQWSSFDDRPCPCRTCERVCDPTCSCPDAGIGFIRRLAPDEQAERTWNGVVQVSDVSSCTSGGCLSPENAPLNETFNVHLCYVNQVAGFVAPDGGRGQGDFPRIGVTCVDKQFMPTDGVVEVGPQRGAACTTTADCKGKDELCFGGACTAGCPANDFPILGSNWSLYVASPDDRGFFTTTVAGTTTTYAGTGTLTSVVFQGSIMVLQLSRAGSGGPLTASVSIGMPQGAGAPLVAGSQVTVKLVDASTDSNPGNRAAAVWDATGTLVFAGDMAQQGPILTATDLTPFSVSSGTVPIGCRIDDCGKLLFYPTHFTGPSASLDLDPGKQASANTSIGTWAFLSVSNGAYQGTTQCTLSDLRPWALWKVR